MGPLESFLRSINCYPDHEQNRKRESVPNERKKYSRSTQLTSLLQPTLHPPPLMCDAPENAAQASNTGDYLGSVIFLIYLDNYLFRI